MMKKCGALCFCMAFGRVNQTLEFVKFCSVHDFLVSISKMASK